MYMDFQISEIYGLFSLRVLVLSFPDFMDNFKLSPFCTNFVQVFSSTVKLVCWEFKSLLLVLCEESALKVPFWVT
jgi:hypothetical protein